MKLSLFLVWGKIYSSAMLMSKCESERKSDKSYSRVPGIINTGRAFKACSPQIRSFSEKSKSIIFLPASVFRILSDLSENAEP